MYSQNVITQSVVVILQIGQLVNDEPRHTAAFYSSNYIWDLSYNETTDIILILYVLSKWQMLDIQEKREDSIIHRGTLSQVEIPQLCGSQSKD